MAAEDPRVANPNAPGARIKMCFGRTGSLVAPGRKGSGKAGAALRAGGATYLSPSNAGAGGPAGGAVFPRVKEAGQSAKRAGAARYQPPGTKAGDAPKQGADDAGRKTFKLADAIRKHGLGSFGQAGSKQGSGPSLQGSAASSCSAS